MARHGRTEPRIETKPLRKLTPETSRGFEVIEFAEQILHVLLFPWQKRLLVHLMELKPDGTLRFRKALVIVGRQNGKTLIAAILAAYWLWIDSVRWPDVLPPNKFVVVGAAQKLDIAMKPWNQVRSWGGPDDVKIGISPERVPALQRETYPPRMVNGEVALRTRWGAQYLPRTFDGARGHSAARAILDELREHEDFEAWAAIEKSTSAQFDSLLVAFSNAGTARSKILRSVRDTAHAQVDDPVAEWFVAEWSALPEASLDDPVAFEMSNPSVGYHPGMTIEGLLKSAENPADVGVERTEVLGQWVTSKVAPHIDPPLWKGLEVPVLDVRPKRGARTVWGFDVSVDRNMAWLAAATWLENGMPFATVRVKRAGAAWILNELPRLAAESGFREVVIQERGCPAMEWIEPLEAAGLHVHSLPGAQFALSAGRLKDHARNKDLVLVEQPDIDLAIEGAVATRYADNLALSRSGSLPVDISGVIAMAEALYGLEVLKAPDEPKPAPPPPPQAGVLLGSESSGEYLVNLANVQF